jgi:hypothetical protein
MNRDHLRLVSRCEGPRAVTQMETLSFAQVEGGLIILHNDNRITPSQAVGVLAKMICMLQGWAAPGRAAAGPQRRFLPGDMGGGETAEVQPLFAENRHQRGYPIERPRPICAETEGDMS